MDGEVRVLRQRRDLWDSGFSLSPAFQPSLEAQRETCEGNRQRFPAPRLCLYQVYALR